MREVAPKRAGINAVPFTVSSWVDELGFPAGSPLVPRTISLERALEARFDGDLVAMAFARGLVVDRAGRALAADTPVAPGERVYIFRPVPDEPAEPIRLAVLVRGEGWIAVDKPHGLASIPRGSHVAQSVTVAARRQFHNDDIQAAHRLDAATAGVMLLVTRPELRGAIQRQFERREVMKHYEALAGLDALSESQRTELRRGITSRLRLLKRDGGLAVSILDGEPNAVTHVRLVEERGSAGKFVVVPETGKTHQIRATMRHLGVPILGDPIYGRESSGELQLVARSLEFVDPETGLRVRVESREALTWPG